MISMCCRIGWRRIEAEGRCVMVDGWGSWKDWESYSVGNLT